MKRMALILAGGQGTRLQSVWNGPKVLAPVAGRPFLSYLLDQLVDASFDCAIICTGYCAGQIAATFGDVYRSLLLVYSPETEPLGTAGSIRQAAEMVASGDLLVLNGDSWCDMRLNDFQAWHHARERAGSLVLTTVPDVGRYGGVTTDAEDVVTRFQEKGAAGPGWINAGVYYLSRALIASIPRDVPVSLERDVFPQWIGRGLYGFCGGGKFLDIGTSESYAAAEQFFTTSC